MRVLIVEDEEVAADNLAAMLKRVRPDCEVMAKIASIRQSVLWLHKHSVDLIFLDIELSDGLSFSIFEHITIKTPIIFTTAYDQYAIKAFDLNSVAYLLKPIGMSDLEQSLEKYEAMKSAFIPDLRGLLEHFENGRAHFKKRFLIRLGEKFRKLEVSDIAYCYAMDKDVYALTFHNQKLPMDSSLDVLENQLDPAIFFRINRKYLVNMQSIKAMTILSRTRVKLELDPPALYPLSAIVSVQRSADFKKWMGS